LVPLCVFVLAAALLGWRAAEPAPASSWIDPVSRLVDQDEATYAHTSLRMAESGDWLTPYFMGRFAFYKTPFYYWLSATCVELFGPTRLAIRLPSILAGAFLVTLVFLWLWRTSPASVAFAGALLLAGSHAFFVFARVGLMDMTLAATTAGALFLLDADPKLERRATWIGFGAFSALAILAKSVAGLLAPMVLVVFWAMNPRRLRVVSVARAVAVAFALAAPWFVYQWMTHRAWFVAEFWQRELLGYGWSSPVQTSGENAFLFYARRLWAVDPFVVLLALAAIPGLWVIGRRTGDHQPALLAAWVVVAGSVLFVFSYRSASYLLPLFPALAVIAAGYAPRPVRVALPFMAVALFGLKVAMPEARWGLPFAAEQPNPAAPALQEYCRTARGNTLFIVQPDDQFYSSLLNLAGVRYVFVTGAREDAEFALNFEKLGISVTAAEFAERERLMPVWRGRLAAMGLNSVEPVGTVVRAPDVAELSSMIEREPMGDFSLPEGLVDVSRFEKTHTVWRPQAGRVFLISRQQDGKCATGRCGI
jgi:hypothetical protein